MKITVYCKETKGQGLVETALIFPFLLVLIIGIMEASIALQRQIVVVNAAREGARFGSFGASADDVHTQTLLATSQMFEFTEENAVVAVIHAETNDAGDGFEEWTKTTYPIIAPVSYVTQDKVLEQLQAEGNAGNLKLIAVEICYDHQSVLGLPFIGALANQIPIGSWTVMRMAVFDKDMACCALPITLPIEDVENLSIGDELVDIRIAEGPGQFGWLFWRPDTPGAGSVPVLEANLRNPCNTKNFRDPCTSSTKFGVGSWVWGKSGESVADDVRDEIEELVGVYYPVPVWDKFAPCNVLKTQGMCNNCHPGSKVAHIVGFALMEITDVKLTSDPKTISAKFRGWYSGCE